MSNNKRKPRLNAKKKADLEAKEAVQRSQRELPPPDSNQAPTNQVDAEQVAQDLYESVLRQVKQYGPKVQESFWLSVCCGEGTKPMRELITLVMRLLQLKERPEQYPGRLNRIHELQDKHPLLKPGQIAALMRGDKEHPEWAWVKSKNGTKRPINGEDVRATVNDWKRRCVNLDDHPEFEESNNFYASLAISFRAQIKTIEDNRRA